MEDEQTGTPVPPESTPAPATTPAPAATATPADSETEKWKTLSRKHETQAKANADKAKAYDDLLAQLTGTKDEADKAKSDYESRIAALETASKTAQFEAARARIAAAKGVRACWARVGQTPDFHWYPV
jgi:recombination DNA repair RAD52 pathway protein